MITLKHLEDWQAQHAANNRTTQLLRQLMHIEADSPIYKAIWDTFNRYTEALAEASGVPDGLYWLKFWEVDKDMGKDLRRSEDEIVMTSLQDLLVAMGCVPAKEQPQG